MFTLTATFYFYSKFEGQEIKDYSSSFTGGEVEAQRSEGVWARMHSEKGPRPVLTSVTRCLEDLAMPCARKGLVLMNYLVQNKPSCYLGRGRKRDTCDRGRWVVVVTGTVLMTGPYVGLTSTSSHPGSSLWPGQPSQRAGPGGRPAGRSGAETAACQARQLQHRGASGGG